MTGTDEAAVRSLLERVESATEADREIDRALCEVFHPDNYAIFTANYQRDLRNAAKNGITAEHRKRAILEMAYHNVQRFTASIDAALALVERVLPEAAFVIHGPDAEGLFWSGIAASHGDAWDEVQDTSGATPPLAILAALLRAKLATLTEARENVEG